MGLGQSLQNSLGGLNATQRGIELTSRNIANANTPGYTKKSLTLDNQVAGDKAFGVKVGPVTREVNQFLQSRLRTEYADYNMLQVQDQFLDNIDTLFGKPGQAGSLDTIVNKVNDSLVKLSNTPQSNASRMEMVENSNYLASHLRDMSRQIQDMRQSAETMLEQEVQKANIAMKNIAKINYELANSGGMENIADLQDQLDDNIDDLAAIFEIKTVETASGGRKVMTRNGILLVNSSAPEITFNKTSNISADNIYSADADKSGVGTIKMVSGDGSVVDLIQQSSAGSGTIGGLLELRDKTLVNAQDQLDELAHGLAKTFNSKQINGEAHVDGAAEGFKLDLAALKNGDVAELSFKNNATGLTQKVSFVKVSSGDNLPLKDSVTSSPFDKVIGIDFSGGDASVLAQIQAGLAAINGDITVTNSGSEIQIVDDGAANNIDIESFNATATVSGVQGEGTALNLFTDMDETGQIIYTNSLEGAGQKRGFAARIQVNKAILDDNSLLVKHNTNVDNGDQARVHDMLARFSGDGFTFSSDSGIGTKSSPFTGSIDSFTRQVVAHQTGKAGTHEGRTASQKLLVEALNNKMEEKTKVNVDEEMANLLNLQTAYQANARIVSVVKELMDMLIRM